MTVIRDVEGKWSLNVTTFELPLRKGTRLVVVPKALNRDTPTPCRVATVSAESPALSVPAHCSACDPSPFPCGDSSVFRWGPEFTPVYACTLKLAIVATLLSRAHCLPLFGMFCSQV
jgi:hypothetical protein